MIYFNCAYDSCYLIYKNKNKPKSKIIIILSMHISREYSNNNAKFSIIIWRKI